MSVRGLMDEREEENWLQIDEVSRKRAVKALREHIEAEVSRETLDLWREQYANGERIGSHDPHFHFGLGTTFRNILRIEISEGNLPWVEYPGGKQYKNWDDFYMPALREALGVARA